jgi:hypothetical protein
MFSYRTYIESQGPSNSTNSTTITNPPLYNLRCDGITEAELLHHLGARPGDNFRPLLQKMNMQVQKSGYYHKNGLPLYNDRQIAVPEREARRVLGAHPNESLDRYRNRDRMPPKGEIGPLRGESEADAAWFQARYEAGRAENRECTICIEQRPVGDFIRVTERCTHERKVCRECLQTWIRSSLDGANLDRLSCTNCAQILQHGDVRRIATAEVFKL